MPSVHARAQLTWLPSPPHSLLRIDAVKFVGTLRPLTLYAADEDPFGDWLPDHDAQGKSVGPPCRARIAEGSRRSAGHTSAQRGGTDRRRDGGGGPRAFAVCLPQPRPPTLSPFAQVDRQREEFRQTFDWGVGLYLSGHWEQAKTRLEKARAMIPVYRPYRLIRVILRFLEIHECKVRVALGAGRWTLAPRPD